MLRKLFAKVPAPQQTDHQVPEAEQSHDPKIDAYHHNDLSHWISYINPGMLHESNLDLIYHAVRFMPDAGAVVEIGTFAGLSINNIIHMMKQARRSNDVFSVDEWNFEGADGEYISGSTVKTLDYKNHVIETFKRNLTLFHPDALPHHMTFNSNDFFDRWSRNETVRGFFGVSKQLGGPISFAYIDGDHTYEQSKRDFENVDRFILPGGIIVFDDSSEGSDWGSHRTAVEAAARGDYKIIDKSNNYCIAKI